MKTLLLDRSTWDLTTDASGNIAVASEPYSQAQDAASAIRLFRGELWFDTTKGIPYYATILGKAPSVALMKATFNKAAKTVPGVVSAKSFVFARPHRGVGGQVQIKNSDGQTGAAGF